MNLPNLAMIIQAVYPSRPVLWLKKSTCFLSALVIVLLSVFGFNGPLTTYSQTASVNPALNSWKTYSGVYSCSNTTPLSGATFNPSGDHAIKAQLTALTTTSGTFQVQKNSGSSTFGSGTLYICSNVNNPYSLCSNVFVTSQTVGNTNPTTLTISFSHGVQPSNTNTFYVVYHSNSGPWYYQGPWNISMSSAPASYSVSVNATPSNGGTASGNGNYSAGALCTVTASPFTGFVFDNWTDGNNNVVSAASSYTFAVQANTSLTANFSPVQQSLIMTGGIVSVSNNGVWQEGQSAYVNATLTSNISWTGLARLAWYSSSNTFLTSLGNTVTGLLPNTSQTLTHTTANVISQAGSYIIKLECQTQGQNTWIIIDARVVTVQPAPCQQQFSLNSTLSHLRWPFPSGDWSNRNQWKGANESGGVGSSAGQDGHQGSDYYAIDWNKVQSTDCDSNFYAPMSGTIIKAVNTYPRECNDDGISGGYGNNVIILSSVDNTYVFRVAHLNTVSVTVGTAVQVGDKLGTIGSTGNSSGSHAHCVLYRNTNNLLSGISVPISGSAPADTHATPFDFAADCGGGGNGGGGTTSIATVSNASGLTISPNPVVNRTTISFSQSMDFEIAELKLYNILGQKVFERTLVSKEMVSIDMSSQGNGIYILSLTTDKNDTFTYKVSVQR